MPWMCNLLSKEGWPHRTEIFSGGFGKLKSIWKNKVENFSNFTPIMLRSTIPDTTESDIESEMELLKKWPLTNSLKKKKQYQVIFQEPLEHVNLVELQTAWCTFQNIAMAIREDTVVDVITSTLVMRNYHHHISWVMRISKMGVTFSIEMCMRSMWLLQ